ncbi:MAG: DMT family transporter [Anaerovoracaceae bacterium]
MKSTKTLSLIALVIVIFIWGFDFIALEYMVDYISPVLITFIRVAIAAVVLFIVVLIKEKGLHIKKKDWPRVFLCSIFGMSLYFTVESLGVEQTSGSMASLILATVPVFGMIADRFIYKNRITLIKLLGIFGSILGVLVLVINTGGGLRGNFMGIFYMFIAAVVWTLFVVYTKPLYNAYSLVTVLTGLFIAATITSIPALFVGPPLRFEPNTTAWIVLLVTTFVCIILGEFLYVNAIGRLSVTTVTLFENLLPLVTVIFSFFIFKEMLSGLQLLGGAIIIVSVSLISLKEKSSPENQA